MTGTITHITNRYVFLILLGEFILISWSGVSFTGLTGDTFFSAGVDPFQWLPLMTGVPQWVLSGRVWPVVMDAVMIAGLAWLVVRPQSTLAARIMFLLFWMYYATLTAYLGHRNFQSGMMFVFFPFIFQKAVNRQLALDACRYFIFFFYVSAAFFKFSGTGLYQADHFSQLINRQFLSYAAEASSDWRLPLVEAIGSSPRLGQALIFLSVALELMPFLGFFTRRADKLICLSLICFHLVNWLLMDIAPIGHLSFLCLLLCGISTAKTGDSTVSK